MKLIYTVCIHIQTQNIALLVNIFTHISWANKLIKCFITSAGPYVLGYVLKLGNKLGKIYNWVKWTDQAFRCVDPRPGTEWWFIFKKTKSRVATHPHGTCPILLTSFVWICLVIVFFRNPADNQTNESTNQTTKAWKHNEKLCSHLFKTKIYFI